MVSFFYCVIFLFSCHRESQGFIGTALGVPSRTSDFKTYENRRNAASSVPETPVVADTAVAADKIELSWLEGNSWFWNVGGVKILVDPLFDTLDFGVPLLYKSDKDFYNDYDLLVRNMANEADHILLTQGFPDHCCPKTLSRLSKLMNKSARIVAPPSARSVVERFFQPDRIIYVKPFRSVTLTGLNGSSVSISAFRGSLLGPPTQDPENAYIVRPVGNKSGGVFIEPHCMWHESDLLGSEVDAIITPACSLSIGPAAFSYQILNSGLRALKLAQILNAKNVVAFDNMPSSATGILLKLVTRHGNIEDFRRIVVEDGRNFVEANPGNLIKIRNRTVHI